MFSALHCTEDVDILKAHVEQTEAWLEAAREVADRGGGVDELLEKIKSLDDRVLHAIKHGPIMAESLKRLVLAGLLDYAERAYADRGRAEQARGTE
ncbi:MAG: hypothetical protein JZD41_06590 [Thermoproteus sp.]|nr:hypothetical protein [Thermoproteus sp.]